MQNTQGTAIIRDRGQLTIPEKIRSLADWTSPNSVVSVSFEEDKKIVIKPYEKKAEKVNWDQIWKDIKRIRSFKTKNKRSASEIIAEDRYNH